MPSDTAVVASMYAPIIFPPASALVFKKDVKGEFTIKLPTQTLYKVVLCKVLDFAIIPLRKTSCYFFVVLNFG